MRIIKTFIYGMTAGAGLMYFMDPDRGGRRRALVRDQMVHAANLLEDAALRVNAVADQMGDRTRGTLHETRAGLAEDRVADGILVERVRAAMGRVVSNPGAIQVAAHDGTVTLAGPALRHESHDLLGTVEGVRGVRDVVNRLELHDGAGSVPGLQGTGE